MDLRVVGDVFFGEVRENAVVVDDAVLEYLDERRAPVRVRPFQDFRQVFLHGVHRTRDKAGAGAKGEGGRRNRVFHRPRRRRRRPGADPGGGRVLTLGQPVDLVVEQQDLQVHVAPEHVQKVVAADRQSVTVAGDHPDIEVGPGQLDPGGDGRRPAVDGVEAIGGHVIGKAGRAADAGDENGVLRHRPDLGQGALHDLEDGVIAAAGTPAHLLVGGEVLRRRLVRWSDDVHLRPPFGRGSPSRSRRS